MEIQKDIQNKLLNRREVVGVVQAETNPGFAEVLKTLSALTKADAEAIAIKDLRSNYGSNEFVVEAFVYKSKEDKEKVEPRQKAKKGGKA
jgi:ribosomal protein S24E